MGQLMKLNAVKTQHEKDLKEYYANRSKYTKIKPYVDQWMVYGRTIVNTLAEAVQTRGKV